MSADENKNLNRTVDTIFNACRDFLKLAWDVLKEIAWMFKERRVPWDYCCGLGFILLLFRALELDTRLAYFLHLQLLLRLKFLYWSWIVTLATSGVWSWGLYQALLKKRLLVRIREACINADLVSKLGRHPSFVRDVPVGGYLRRLRLNRAGFSKADFESRKDRLASHLNVEVIKFEEQREKGTIDMIYSHHTPKDLVEFGEIHGKYPNYSFLVGHTRAGELRASLIEVPHLLIGGVTNFGKSTFFRQFVTTLYLNNPLSKFVLIDLKGGLEFQTFEGLSRVSVVSNTRDAMHALALAEIDMEGRFKILKEAKCKDLQAFEKMVQKNFKHQDERSAKAMGRTIIVIDEATELFLAGGSLNTKEAHQTRRSASKIAAQGRAVGVHLIVGTQRPDRNAVDPLTKTNLQGRLCFPMSDNASSMTILDSVMAADLPQIKGRAAWRNGMDLVEVQTPLLTTEQADEYLKPDREVEASSPLVVAERKGTKIQARERISTPQEADTSDEVSVMIPATKLGKAGE